MMPGHPLARLARQYPCSFAYFLLCSFDFTSCLSVCLPVCLPFLLARSFVNTKPTSISVWTLAIGCLDGLPIPRHTTIHQPILGTWCFLSYMSALCNLTLTSYA